MIMNKQEEEEDDGKKIGELKRKEERKYILNLMTKALNAIIESNTDVH